MEAILKLEARYKDLVSSSISVFCHKSQNQKKLKLLQFDLESDLDNDTMLSWFCLFLPASDGAYEVFSDKFQATKTKATEIMT